MTTVGLILEYSTLAIFLSVTTTPLGKVITYAIVAGICALVWAFLYKVLSETNCIPLSEIPELFLSPENKMKAEEMHLKFFSEITARDKTF